MKMTRSNLQVERIVRRLIGLVLLLSAAAPARAAELSPSAQTEIDALLNRLGTSKCQFYRNGSWHSGVEARDHLQMKLEYLVEKGLITDSEEFIEKAGTESSMSGSPTKCGAQTRKNSPAPCG